ncbi:hypothetical protein COLU111180_18125 [Cohnella lubricantis]|uniref:DUF975 family protein n=1 Tax=Cohnella lubricantis TaxID=2163172 RepID=A0A841TJS0_9BACL|nr:hypothetical protein [Cohnella lubricantis]MBB6679468.1 hypothetical protein [Cohnella lubricantis]MBP2118205.1 hypothetical protein [Cohnella lubricantis]
MRKLLGKGWDMTRRHKYVLVVLFLYRLLWGFFLYRFVDHVVTPVLARYPDGHPNSSAAGLFWIEAQFRLMKTDILDDILWMLAGMFLLRMVLTPLLNAGLFYSFSHSAEADGTRVIAGIRKAWKPVAALYWFENGLVLLPLVWLVPHAKSQLFSVPSLQEWAHSLLPLILAWIVWSFAVHLAFQFMQFSAAAGDSILSGLGRACRRALPLIAVTLSIAGIGIGASLAQATASMLWTGFAAIALQQAYQLVRSLFTLWTAASQFELWRPEQAA